MIVTPGTAFSLPWYDRGMETIAGAYSTLTGPHGTTSRLSYTVPVGKIVRMNHIGIYIFRETPATTPAATTGVIQIIPNGGSLSLLIYNKTLVANAGEKIMGESIPFLIMMGGDFLEFTTTDDSTGGTILYEFAYYGVTYNA